VPETGYGWVSTLRQRVLIVDLAIGVVVDTEAIASEIVYLKNRLAELDTEGAEGTDVDDEKKELHERMRILQDSLSGNGSVEPKTHTQADEVHFINPA
jgi:hypothetical protein